MIQFSDFVFDALKDEKKIFVYNIADLFPLIKNKSAKEIALDLKINPRSAAYIKNNQRPLSFPPFIILCHTYGFPAVKSLQVAYGFGSSQRKHLLPLIFSEELAYLVGYLYGDGCLFSKKATLSFVDEYNSQIDRISKLVKSIFGCRSTFYSFKGKTELRVYSSIMKIFMNKIFEMPCGTKTGLLHLPLLIQSNSLKLKRSFLCGLMDADGGVCRIEEYAEVPRWFVNSPQIDLTQKDKCFLEEVKAIFLELEIIPSGPHYNPKNKCYKLVISSRKCFKKCNEIKIFEHPVKKNRLEYLSNFLTEKLEYSKNLN